MLPDFFSLLKQPRQLLALGLGSGLSPKAPGTVGTIAAIPFYLLIALLPLPLQLLVIAISFGIGVYLCEFTANDLGVHDHPAIVWDEFVGFWLTMLALPIMGEAVTLWWILYGFILFRFFDIVKPWPIRWVDQKVSGGLGIMLDDMLAGIYSLICLGLLISLLR